MTDILKQQLVNRYIILEFVFFKLQKFGFFT